MVTDATTGAALRPTVTVAVPRLSPAPTAAVIDAVPGARAVTSPRESTVATAGRSESQRTADRSPSGSAVRTRAVSPGTSESVRGAIARSAGAAGRTVSGALLTRSPI